MVSDGNRASRESFDDRTLKQKHIFGAGVSNLGSKPPPRMEARNTERMHMLIGIRIAEVSSLLSS